MKDKILESKEFIVRCHKSYAYYVHSDVNENNLEHIKKKSIENIG